MSGVVPVDLGAETKGFGGGLRPPLDRGAAQAFRRRRAVIGRRDRLGNRIIRRAGGSHDEERETVVGPMDIDDQGQQPREEADGQKQTELHGGDSLAGT